MALALALALAPPLLWIRLCLIWRKRWKKIEILFFPNNNKYSYIQTTSISKMFSISNITSECFNTHAFAQGHNAFAQGHNAFANIHANNMLKKSELTALIVGFICVYLIADYVAQIICEKIEARQAKMQSILMEDLKYRDAELQSLLKENVKLKEELDFLKASKKEATNTEPSKQKIIQCDKCYNEYAAENIHTSYFIQKIKQQYCNECFYRVNTQKQIKKSQSDSQFRYLN